jgi:large subunit ribosomal protein L4
LKKQKGTGGARAGSVKSGTRVGGGRIFGPEPRDYTIKLNTKLKRLARKSALSYKASNDNIVVLEDLNFDAPKTKNFVEVLNNLKLDNDKVLLVTAGTNGNVHLSARNLQKAKVVSADSLNTYDIMNASKLVLAAGSIELIEKTLN